MADGLPSMTTIWAGLAPLSIRVSTALRPLVPYPTTTTWLRICFLQRVSRKIRAPSLASTCRAVPRSRIRNAIRNGVTTRALSSRACGWTGVMSP